MLAVAVVAAVVPSARADYRITGHGFGHGVGLAQYGAMGYARAGQGHPWILRQYFTGTRLESVAPARMRVRLKETSAGRVTGATLARAANGRRVTLDAARTYRFIPWRADGLEAVDLRTGRTRAHVPAPLRLTGGAPLRVLGPADNGVLDGRYRGAIVLSRSATRVLVVDDVELEQYLYGVVPAEMPSGWPAAALRAQAVTARSYALTSLAPTAPFDVYADTRSQVYRGVVGERATTTAAVRATRRIAVTAGGAVAHTLFHSSSGGRTAAIEDVFGGPPVTFLRSVEDPYDRLSPYHDWTVTLTDADAAVLLRTVCDGELVDVTVMQRTPGGRAAVVRITGTLGVRDIDGRAARSLLGLRSTWFDVARTGGAR